VHATQLDPLFRPRSIVLIGADRQPRSVGEVVARNLFSGRFEGPVMPVHARLPAVRGVLAFPSIGELPVVPDLAVIATPADTVPGIVGELGARGTRMAIVLSAGLDAIDGEHAEGLRAAATGAGVRLVGPACLGIMVPSIGLNATFAHAEPKQGDIALVCQSGSLASILLDSPAGRDAGFSIVASLGDMIDVDFGDVFDFLALDPMTRSVLVAVDHISDARRFMSAARMLARVKPVIVFDAGRRDGRRDASDPGSMSRDGVYEAAFRRAGMLPVPLLTDLVAAAGTLAAATRVGGNRLAIICNGGAIARVTMQMWSETGAAPAALGPQTQATLDTVLPPGWRQRNPVNIFADASAERFRVATTALLADEGVDILLVIVCPTAIGDTLHAAEAICEALPQGRRGKPVAVVWLDEATRGQAQAIFARQRIAVHPSVRWAVTAFAQLLSYQRNQEMLIETPASVPDLFSCDRRRAEAVIEAALAAGRTWLGPEETEAVLAAYDLPTLPSTLAGTDEEAVAAADALGYPVALRLVTDAAVDVGALGGIVFDLEDADAVRAAAHRIARRVGELRPDLTVGFAVGGLTGKADAHATRLGVAPDPVFGPIISFGQGGNRTTGLADVAIGLPPLNLALARTMMAETRVWWALHGAGDHPPASIEEAALAVVRLSQIAADLPQVQEVDINPLLTDADGVAALSARIRVAAVGDPATTRLAIRPYPVELEKEIVTRAGKRLHLRPIRPEDEPALRAFVRQMSPEDIRLRFFSPLKELDHRFAARLTQIDYDREMALVAIDPEAEETSIWGVMRFSADASGSTAEYAGSVRSDLQGEGLGRILMEEIIACARRRGIGEIWGEVLAENQGMLSLARKLGFRLNRDPDDPSVIHVVKSLGDG
jgi:Acyl-CoA synthetase (NDP forming)